MQSAAEQGANDAQPSTTGLAGLLGSAVTLTGITAALYLIGIVYAQGYFGRFGIQFAYLSFPTSFYLYRSILSVVLVVALFGSAMMIRWDRPNTALQALAGNYPALAGIVVILVAIVRTSGFSEAIGLVLVFIVSLLAIIYVAIRRRYSMMHRFGQRSLGAILIFSLLAFVTAAVVAYSEGHRAAGETIEGDEDRALRVTLQMKDPANVLVAGKNLILVLSRDEGYFVVEQQSPAPEHPRVYVIPRDQVVGAVIERAGS